MRKKPQVCTSLDSALIDRLDEAADKSGIRKNEIIAQGVEIRVKQIEEGNE